MDFLILLKPFLMDKTRTVRQKWLANELDLQFLTLKKCIKGQSNRSIFSKVIVYTDRQTPSQKRFFLTQGSQNVEI